MCNINKYKNDLTNILVRAVSNYMHALIVWARDL